MDASSDDSTESAGDEMSAQPPKKRQCTEASGVDGDDKKFPSEFFCPVTCDLMAAPTTLRCGHTVDQQVIKKITSCPECRFGIDEMSIQNSCVNVNMMKLIEDCVMKHADPCTRFAWLLQKGSAAGKKQRLMWDLFKENMTWLIDPKEMVSQLEKLEGDVPLREEVMQLLQGINKQHVAVTELTKRMYQLRSLHKLRRENPRDAADSNKVIDNIMKVVNGITAYTLKSASNFSTHLEEERNQCNLWDTRITREKLHAKIDDIVENYEQRMRVANVPWEGISMEMIYCELRESNCSLDYDEIKSVVHSMVDAGEMYTTIYEDRFKLNTGHNN